MLTIRTSRVHALFIEALARCGNVTAACESAGISREAAYKWRREDADFASDWEEALALGVSGLEDRATELAMMGNEKLIMFLLASRKPDIYGQKSQLEVRSTVTIALRNAPIEELRAELAGYLTPRAPLTIDNVVPLLPRHETDVTD